MYILKNAWVSITRNKGRNILIAIIVTVIAAACAVTLSIKNSAEKIVASYEEKYQVEATIGMDRSALQDFMKDAVSNNNDDTTTEEKKIEAFNNRETITVEEINNYGDSKYVSSYYYVYELGMDAENLDKATSSLTKETTTTTTDTETKIWSMPPGGFQGESSSGGSSTTKRKVETKTEIIGTTGGDFTLKGYSSYESMTDFVAGNYTVNEGGTALTDFESTSECMISSELAELNELKVGDTIKLVNPEDDDLTYKLTIVGIYTDSSDDSSNMASMYSNSANTIIVSAATVEKILSEDEDLNATVTPTFILTGSDVVDAFSKEVEEKGLNDYYAVNTNLEEVEAATKSITNVKTFATTFLVITLIIGGVVLLVLNMINIRERKYEIGVLRTIGMKKITVISQFVIELLIVSLVGLTIGAGIGAASSVSVANNLLANEIANASEEKEDINSNFGFGGPGGRDFPGGMMVGKDSKINGVVDIEQVDSINATMDFKVLAELFGIGILLTIISSLSACVAISRFSPLQILKERS